MYFFNRERLDALAGEYREAWKDSEPFPHIVIDNFLPNDVALQIAAEFPTIEQIEWNLAGPGDSLHTGDRRVEKLASSNEEEFPATIRHTMYGFQSGVFLRFLESLSGFSHLSADPHHFGCGLHSTGRGGRLMVHRDASRHPNKDYIQLINLIYYCTADWQEDYGGHLQFWDGRASRCVKKIAPVFNRAVLFYTGSKSYHGHPEPLVCPEGMRRNSLALYYYSTDQTQGDLAYTNYVEWKHATPHDRTSLKHRIKKLVRMTMPPRVVNALAALVRKF